jgi:CubicO group peptidase (beta-lactamase class C family)
VPAEEPLPLPPGVERVEALLEPIREAHDAPALGAVVVRGGELVGIGAVGVRREAAADPVTVHDRWHLGSVTKSITALAVAYQVQAGKLSWQEPVREVFPDAHPAWAELSIGRLLQQTAGPPEVTPLELIAWAGDEETSPERARRAWVVSALAQEPEPGEFAYKNANYLIAGAILEEVTGASWTAAVQRDVFDRLGMTRSGFGPPPGWHQPWGHKDLGLGRFPMPPGPGADNPAPLGPAGTAHATLADLAKYLAFHVELRRRIDDGTADPALAFLHTPAEGEDYAGGWLVVDRDWAEGRVSWHNGSNTMWYALLVLAPAQDRAFAVVTNTFDPAVADAAMDALRGDPRFGASTTP